MPAGPSPAAVDSCCAGLEGLCRTRAAGFQQVSKVLLSSILLERIILALQTDCVKRECLKRSWTR